MWSLEFTDGDAFLLLNGRRLVDTRTYEPFGKIKEVGSGRTNDELWITFDGATNGKRVLRSEFSPLNSFGEELVNSQNNNMFIESVCDLIGVSRKKRSGRNESDKETRKRKCTSDDEITNVDKLEPVIADQEIEEKCLGKYEIDVKYLSETPEMFKCREIKNEWVQNIKRKILLCPSPTVTILPVLLDPEEVKEREDFQVENLFTYKMFPIGGNHLIRALKEIGEELSERTEIQLIHVNLFYGLSNLQAKRLGNNHNAKMANMELTFQGKVLQARDLYTTDPEKLIENLTLVLGEIEGKNIQKDSLSTMVNVAKYSDRCWTGFKDLVMKFELEHGCEKNIPQTLFRLLQGLNEEMKFRAIRKAYDESINIAVDWVTRMKKLQILKDVFCEQVQAQSWDEAVEAYPRHTEKLEDFLCFPINRKKIPEDFLKFCREAKELYSVEDSQVMFKDIEIDIDIRKGGNSISNLETCQLLIKKFKGDLMKEIWKKHSNIMFELETES